MQESYEGNSVDFALTVIFLFSFLLCKALVDP